MSGNGTQGGESGERASSVDVHVPSLLADLDSSDAEVQLEAVRTIQATVEDAPKRCVPTVPKLRGLLERPSTDLDEAIVGCLADLAAEAPNDVAPSAETVVQFARAETPHPGTTQALRCLAHVAEERPDVVAAHVRDVVAILEATEGEPIDPWGPRLLATVASSRPEAVEPATSILEDVLAADPEADVREPAERALAAVTEGQPEAHNP